MLLLRLGQLLLHELLRLLELHLRLLHELLLLLELHLWLLQRRELLLLRLWRHWLVLRLGQLLLLGL